MKKLDGQHAIITGGGAGIGRAIAVRFAEEGAKVVIADVNMENARSACEEIVAAGGQAMAVYCDVSDQECVEKMIAQARESYGPVDILVNNAGGAIVGGASQTFGNYTKDFIDKLIGINLMGMIYCAHAVANEMRERKQGKIINLSSIAGLNGSRGNILYGTTKGAAISFTKSLAMDMGPYGVTVNAIAPGAIASRKGPASLRTWLGHPGKCEDIAALALFIASEEGSFMTGETVVMDGGRSCGNLGE